MRKLTFILSILSVLAVSLRTTALPPQWFEVEYHAYVEVFDLNNNPVSGVAVKLTVDARIGEEEYYNIIRTSTGYTNSNGYVSLTCYIDYYDYPQMNCMFVDVIEPGYSHATATGVYSTTSRTLYSDIWIMPLSADQDIDGIPDIWESQIAEKFKPVLHKHPNDRQAGLHNFDYLLDDHCSLVGRWTQAKRYWNSEYEQYMYEIIPHCKTWRGSPLNIHQAGTESGNVTGPESGLPYPYTWTWDSFKQMMPGQTEFTIDIDDDQLDLGAPVGDRPVYYHVFKSGEYFILQYWYFFTMNDLDGQNTYDTWHMGDWEHVTLKVKRVNGEFSPEKVAFYCHSGCQVFDASSCWWSPTNSSTYSALNIGYNDNRTHLHIWIAQNAHASYNRLQNVYKLRITWQVNPNWVIDEYVDNVDYYPTGGDCYFTYDILEKLGEVDRSTYVNPRGNSKEWIAYEGRYGFNWSKYLLFLTIETPSPGPLTMHEEAHHYYYFPDLSNGQRWGNNPPGEYSPATDGQVTWVQDPPDGD